MSDFEMQKSWAADALKKNEIAKNIRRDDTASANDSQQKWISCKCFDAQQQMLSWKIY